MTVWNIIVVASAGLLTAIGAGRDCRRAVRYATLGGAVLLAEMALGGLLAEVPMGVWRSAALILDLGLYLAGGYWVLRAGLELLASLTPPTRGQPVHALLALRRS